MRARREMAFAGGVEQTGDDAATSDELRAARAELVTCLEMQGRVEEARLLGEGEESVVAVELGRARRAWILRVTFSPWRRRWRTVRRRRIRRAMFSPWWRSRKRTGRRLEDLASDVLVAEAQLVEAGASGDVLGDRFGARGDEGMTTRLHELSRVLAGLGAGEAVAFGALLERVQGLDGAWSQLRGFWRRRGRARSW